MFIRSRGFLKQLTNAFLDSETQSFTSVTGTQRGTWLSSKWNLKPENSGKQDAFFYCVTTSIEYLLYLIDKVKNIPQSRYSSL